METALKISDPVEEFREGVDTLLAKREYFIQQILPKLVEGQDYYTIKGRRSLAKGGAEKLASIYSLVATFTRDEDTMRSFREQEDVVAYVCDLQRHGELAGQGRGAARLVEHDDNPNVTIKIAQKRAFIDGVIRTTGLSDIFTQDIHEQSPTRPQKALQKHHTASRGAQTGPSELMTTEETDDRITEKQKNLLQQLVFQRIGSATERERWLQEIESASKYDASEMISSFLMAAGR